MSIWKSIEHNFAIRISTMVDSLSKVFSDWGFCCDFPNDIDTLDAFAGPELAFHEDPQSLDGRRLDFEVIHTELA